MMNAFTCAVWICWMVVLPSVLATPCPAGSVSDPNPDLPPFAQLPMPVVPNTPYSQTFSPSCSFYASTLNIRVSDTIDGNLHTSCSCVHH